jgi:hypothetical protein
MIISDAPSCGITFNCHSDDSRGIPYFIKYNAQTRIVVHLNFTMTFVKFLFFIFQE